MPPIVGITPSRMKKSPHWRSASSENFRFNIAAARPVSSTGAKPILNSSASSGVNCRFFTQ